MPLFLSFTNILIIISFLFTLLVTISPELYVFGMNTIFLDEKRYLNFVLQFFFYSFIHGGLLHFFSNAFFLLYFGNEVEKMIKDTKYLIFFVFTTLFVAVGILVWSSDNTVGISGFCMALITYYTLSLYRRGDPDYRGGLTAIMVNIALGFVPGISLAGHLLGAIAGGIFFYFNKKFLK